MNQKLEKYFLICDEFIYCRLQLLNWVCQGANQSNKLHLATVNELKKVYDSYQTDKPILLDCRRVRDIGNNALNDFLKNTDFSRKIIFWNVNHLDKYIISPLLEYKIEYEHKQNSIIISTIEKGLPKQIEKKTQQLEQKFVEGKLVGCFEPYDEFKRLYSTHVLANGEFDATNLISAQDSFAWISIKLSDLVENYLASIRARDLSPDGKKYSDEKIMAVSFRSSPFAVAVANVLNKNVIIIDHLGPKHNEYDIEILDFLNKGTNIIYVGDFLIGGTEVFISQMYSKMFESDLHFAVVIGSAQSNKQGELCFAEKFEFNSLVNLKELILPKVEKVEYKLFDE
ncbi:MAG: hypothetical protein DRI74_08970 [Bacteroidetes bacterium]|nr:MAG: hypothetical protein DRI74_08970 [Bacteroidota bacterium]